MNPHERIAIWQNILAQAKDRIATVGDRFPSLSLAERGKLNAYDHTMVKNAEETISHYQEKISGLSH